MYCCVASIQKHTFYLRHKSTSIFFNHKFFLKKNIKKSVSFLLETLFITFLSFVSFSSFAAVGVVGSLFGWLLVMILFLHYFAQPPVICCVSICMFMIYSPKIILSFNNSSSLFLFIRKYSIGLSPFIRLQALHNN